MDNVTANHDVYVDKKAYTFGFRKVTDEETKIETKRPSVELNLAIPSLEGIAKILSSGDDKQQKLLLDAVAGVVVDAARDYLSDNPEATADNFDYSKVTFEAIANQPAEVRASRAISKEAWEDFAKAYMAHMISATNAPKQSVNLQAKAMLGKFKQIENHAEKERILNGFQELLTIFTASYPDAQTHSQVIDFLNNRIQKMRTSEAVDLATALGF